MPTYRADLLEVNEKERVPNHHRSRSSGYTDFLEQQVKWEREDRERQMKRYSHAHQHNKRLYVPTFDTTSRRVRSQEEISLTREEPVRTYNEPVRSHNVRVQRPAYDLAGEVALPTQLPVRRVRKPEQNQPAFKVEIHQPEPPKGEHVQVLPESYPSVRHSSQTAHSKPRDQLAILQDKLIELGNICAPKLHIEAASEQDLSFSMIAEEAKGFASQINTWSYVANLHHLDADRESVDLASKTLHRLIGRVSELNEICSVVRPKDLKVRFLPNADDEGRYESSDEDDESDESVEDITETPGFAIQSCLASIRFQIRTLSRLTRSLQEATPEGRVEAKAVDDLTAEVARLFGSSEALKQNYINAKFAGGKALDEARYAAKLSR